MHSALNNNLFLVKEHVGLFKAANNFDIYDPQTGEVILHCREPRLGMLTKLFRFTEYKRFTPFEIEITTPSGEPVCSVHRGLSIFLSTVDVRDTQKETIGSFKQHLFSIGGAFTVLSATGKELCHLKGSWTGWNFRFVADDGTEFAHVTKNGLVLGRNFLPAQIIMYWRLTIQCRRIIRFGRSFFLPSCVSIWYSKNSQSRLC